MMQRAVLWDMDGVLVEDGEWHYRAWYETLSAAGIPFDRRTFQQTFGMNNAGILEFLLGHRPPADFIQEISERKEARFRDLIRGQVRLASGAREWLERLAGEGFLQAVASSAPQANLEALLAETQAAAFFAAVVSGAGMPGKPDPAVFLEAARRLGVPPACCVVVEDSVAGVVAARRAGMRCLALTTTNPRSALGEADIVVDSLTELCLNDFLGHATPAGRKNA